MYRRPPRTTRTDILFPYNRLAVALEVDERSQLLLQDGRCTTDRLFGIQGAVGFQVNDQFVQVGALLDTSILDHVSHATNRAESGVELQPTDATDFLFIPFTPLTRHRQDGVSGKR